MASKSLLRFKGFNDNYKKAKIGGIFKFISTNSLSRENMNTIEGCVRNIHYGDIHMNYPTIVDAQKCVIPFVNMDVNLTKVNLSDYCKDGDVVIADASEDYADIGKSIELININNSKITCGLHTIHGRDINGILCNGYRGYLLNSPSVKAQIKILATGSKVLGITKANIQNVELNFPSQQEQAKIAEFIYIIDNRIDCQKRIIETLEKLKMGYMQKIFSQQLRFKDENGEDFPEWEKVMIGDIATLKNGYSFKSDSYDENGTYNIITIGNVTGDKYINVEKSNKIIELPNSIQKHQILKQNDILVSLTGNVGRVSLNKGSNNLLNQRVGLIEVNGNISPMFIYYCLSLKEFEKSMNNSGNGLAQLNIGKSTIEEYTIFVPNLVEQEIIVSFLELLDEKIDTEKTKLINLQKLKLGYLQQMFI